jgi:hypothetical protein
VTPHGFDDQNRKSFPDVIASVSQRSNLLVPKGLFRRFAPRNDYITELERQNSSGAGCSSGYDASRGTQSQQIHY